MKYEIPPFPNLEAQKFVNSSNRTKIPEPLTIWMRKLETLNNTPRADHKWIQAKTAFYKKYPSRPNRNQDTTISRLPTKMLNPYLKNKKNILCVGGGTLTGNTHESLLLRDCRNRSNFTSLDPYQKPTKYSLYPVSYIKKSITNLVDQNHFNSFDAVLCLTSIMMDLIPHRLLDAFASLRQYSTLGGIVAIDINTRYNDSGPFVFTRNWLYPENGLELKGEFLNLTPLMLKVFMKLNGFAHAADYPYTSPDITTPNPRYLGIWQKEN